MRILIEPGDFAMTNLGDVAMLQVAVTRLSGLWPEARIDVVTSRPDRLRRFCPAVFAVPTAGQERWLRDGTVFGGSIHRRLLGARLAARSGEIEARLRHRWPRLVYGGLRAWQVLRPAQTREVTAFFKALSGADLLVVSGAGDLTSTFERHAISTLRVVRLAQDLGAPTVFFGQGIGPIETPRLRSEAQAVLPRADLIAIREKRKSARLLDDLGVARDRVAVTGDDAIEVAYGARSSVPGDGIGMNLRSAFYSAVQPGHIARMRAAVHAAAARHAAPLVPLPVRLAGVDSDVTVLRLLLEGYQGPVTPWEQTETPRQLAELIGRCRVVVTGSYHGAVFALAQGIPAVALAASDYYVDKFLGLAEMFGRGCELVRLDDPEFTSRLEEAIARAWAQAEGIRPLLLDAAARQIAEGRAAYARCRERVRAYGRHQEKRFLRVGE